MSCEPCKTQSPCLQFPIVFYNFGDGKNYANELLSFDVTCPNGLIETVYIQPGTITFRLPFPVGFTGEYPPLVLSCAAGGYIVRNIPSGSSQAAIDDIVNGMIYECAQSLAEQQAACPDAVFGNDPVTFDPACAVGSVLTFSGSLPSWLTIDTATNTVIGAGGVYTSTSTAAATALAQAALDTWATEQIALGTLTCVSGPSCVTPAGTIAMTPTPGFAPQLTISTDVGTNRMMAVTPGGLNGRLEIFNTATNASIFTDPALGFDPYAGVYAPSNQTFWIGKLDGINNDAIRKYDKDGAFITEITPSPGFASGLTIAYETTTGKLWEAASDPTDYVVWDIDPATNAATRHVLAAGASGPGTTFSCPGFIIVNMLPPELSASVFKIYTVPGLVLVGTINMSVPGWDQGFAYSPDTGKIYFSTGAPELWEINPATAVVDFVYTLTERIMALASDVLVKRLFGVSGITGTGSVIDPVGRSVVCTLAVTSDASTFWDIAIDPNVAGRIYVNNNSANQLLIYT